MTMNRKDREEAKMAESADRRQFLRNAMKIGGAAALLLTSASREMLANSLSLSSHDLEEARRAQQVKGAKANTERMQASAAQPTGGYNGCDCSGCSGCTGTCSDSCGNACTSCTGGCQGTCAGGCRDSCKGSSK